MSDSSNAPSEKINRKRKKFFLSFSPRQWSPLAWVLLASGSFFVVFLAISGFVFLKGSSNSGAKPSIGKTSLFRQGTVGVIELNGVIMDSKRLVRRIERMSESPEVDAIVLRINSPGGAVAPSQEIYEAIKAIKKPVVASMGSVAASGGYYVACAAKKIFANPGTITGSIGVIMEFANLSKLYEWAKVKRYSIKTGKFKDAGAEYREMDPESRALLQSMVDDVLVQFKQAVAAGRKLKMEQVTRVADGRIFSGAQARAVGLVDELGTFRDAVNEAARMAQIKGKPEVLYPEKSKPRFFEMLMDERRDEEEVSAASSGVFGLLERLLGREGAAGTGATLGLRAPGIYWLWVGGA